MSTVTETANGATSTVVARVFGDGQTATISAGEHQTVRIRDIYRFVAGSLLVRKTIAGPGPGQQGPITIHTVCNGNALKPDFAIPAGAPAGDQTKQYDRIRVPAQCTVTETGDGHTARCWSSCRGVQTVSVAAGGIAEADISDTYGLLPGQLEVTKTIAGSQAGRQGMVVIRTVCNGTPLTPDLVILAGAAAGDRSRIYSSMQAPATCTVTETADGHTSAVSVNVTGSPPYSNYPGRIAAGTPAGSVSHSFDGVPAGSVCSVTETSDGATSTVTATVSGGGQDVTVPGGMVVSVQLADVYEAKSGSLTVIKTIAGPAVHRHGRIAIVVDCAVRSTPSHSSFGPAPALVRCRAISTGSRPGPVAPSRDRGRTHQERARRRKREPQGDRTRRPQGHGSSH